MTAIPTATASSPTTPDWENYWAKPADDRLWAASKDAHRPVQELLDALRDGADPRFPDGVGHTPLHMAACYGDRAKVEALLAAGAYLEARDDRHSDTPLHAAVRHGNEEAATALLDAGASTTARNSDKRTPADLLPQARGVAPPEVLVRLSAKLTKAASTARLATAAADQGAPIAEAKAMSSADATPFATDWDVAERVVATTGALWGSVMNPEAPARWTSEAVEWGADVNYRDLNGDTAMHIAARSGNAEKIAALHKARADMNAQDAEGRTPLHVAAEIGNTETARALLAAGANPDAKGVCRQTPREIMESRCTPLHRAARDGSAQEINRLLDAGAELDAVDGFGQTALHRAARHGNEPAAAALLAAGADPRAKNLQQRTPLTLLMVDRKALGLSDDAAAAIAHRLIFANANLREREAGATPAAQPGRAAGTRKAETPRVVNVPLSR